MFEGRTSEISAANASGMAATETQADPAAPSHSSNPGETLRSGGFDPVKVEDRPSQATLARAWQRCRETPTENAVWEELFRRLSPALGAIISRTVCRWGVRERADVDDLLQDTALKIWELSQSSRRLPEDEIKLYGYFRAMAVNTALTWIRRQFTEKRNLNGSIPLADQLSSLIDEIRPGRAGELNLLIREIDQALDCSRRDRNIFWLYYRQGFTAAEIAAIPAFGLSVKGVESLIHRLTAHLRERMR